MFGLTTEHPIVSHLKRMLGAHESLPDSAAPDAAPMPLDRAKRLRELFYQHCGRYVVAAGFSKLAAGHGYKRHEIRTVALQLGVRHYMLPNKLPLRPPADAIAEKAHAAGKSVWYIPEFRPIGANSQPNGPSAGRDHPGNVARGQGF